MPKLENQSEDAPRGLAIAFQQNLGTLRSLKVLDEESNDMNELSRMSRRMRDMRNVKVNRESACATSILIHLSR